MIPAKLDSYTVMRGDLWREGYKHFTINPGFGFAECVFVRIQFRDAKGKVGHELNSDPKGKQGTITIVDPETYEFDTPNQPLPVAPGTWTCRLETFTDLDVPGDTWLEWKVIVKSDV